MKKFSYDELLSICNDIFHEECNKHNLEIKFNLVGKLAFYKTNFYKESFKLYKSIDDKIDLLKTPFVCYGFHNKDKKTIIVFYNDYKLINTGSLVNTLFTLYHEIYHSIEHHDFDNKNTYDWSNYYNFICELELFGTRFFNSERIRYLEHHDSFLFEIIADTYAIINTRKYLNDHNISYNKDELDKLDNYNENNYKMFSPLIISNKIIENYSIIKNNLQFKTYLFDVFLTDEGIPKDLNTILNDMRLKDIDKDIIKCILLSSKFRWVNNFNNIVAFFDNLDNRYKGR